MIAPRVVLAVVLLVMLANGCPKPPPVVPPPPKTTTGEEPASLAGYMNRRGKMFFLMLKGSQVSSNNEGK